ncbi:MAG: hypothetical protein AAF804_06660 [Bacteroidota bacterium]
MKSLSLILLGLLCTHLSLTAQVFIANTPFISSVVNVPHTLAPVQKHLKVQLTDELLGKAKGTPLSVVTLLLPQKPLEKSFPGTIFAGKQDAMVEKWLAKTGIVPYAAALSRPLAASTKPQSITFVEKVPDDLYQRLGIKGPSADSDPKPMHISLKGKSLSNAAIWAQAPTGSRFALVTLLWADGEMVQAKEPSVMLVFF